MGNFDRRNKLAGKAFPNHFSGGGISILLFATFLHGLVAALLFAGFG